MRPKDAGFRMTISQIFGISWIGFLCVAATHKGVALHLLNTHYSNEITPKK
jgi:hypothetical protein